MRLAPFLLLFVIVSSIVYADETDNDFDGVTECDTCADKCPDTLRGDPVDANGCSCEQGGSGITLPSGDKVTCSSFWDLLNEFFFGAKCPDGRRLHCCNGSFDRDSEFLTDCGKECGACQGGPCTYMGGSGNLDIILFTKHNSGYSSANLGDWESRTAEESNRILSTPPFNNGVTVWRLDVLNYGTIDSEQAELGSICPADDGAIDKAIFLKADSCRSGSGLNYYSGTVCYKEYNAIVHELGHMVCGLDDEYGNVPGLGEEVNIHNNDDSINCDKHPKACHEDTQGNLICRDLGTSKPGPNEEVRCRWYDSYPDSGCIPGCMYHDEYYRMAKDHPESMMSGIKYPIGEGWWNRIGWDTCVNAINSY